MSKTRINFYALTTQAKALLVLAKRTGSNVSTLIRQAIAEFLERRTGK